jgi:hypothetical protein
MSAGKCCTVNALPCSSSSIAHWLTSDADFFSPLARVDDHVDRLLHLISSQFEDVHEVAFQEEVIRHQAIDIPRVKRA